MLRKSISYFILFFINVLLLWYPINSSAIELQSLSIKGFEKVMADKKEITLVFIFTSWCRVCKESFPELLSLSDKYNSDDRVKVIILSLDEKATNLDAMAKKYKNNKNKIHCFEEDITKKNIGSALFENGIRYNGTIPHITIFNKGEAIVNDNYEIQSVKNFINHLYDQGIHGK